MHSSALPRALAALLLSVGAMGAVQAQQPHELIASTVSAAAAERAVRGGAMVLDLRSAEAYAQGHLPGALSAPGATEVLDRAGLQALVSRLGLDLSRGTVLVGEPGDPRVQGFQTALQAYAAAPVRWLVGGVSEWQLSARALQREAVERPPVPQVLSAYAAPAHALRMAGASVRDLATPAATALAAR